MTLDSIATLRNYSSSVPNERCDVLGYETPGDGGDGAFFWNPACDKGDDMGTIIRPNSVPPQSTGRWLRIFNTSLNAKWFGAKGDGTTDDTIALTQAITTASKTCGELILPKGIYNITETIRADINASVSIVGYCATIKPVSSNITPHHILSIAPFPEKPLLAIGPSAVGSDKTMAFPTTDSIKIRLSGLTFDGTSFPMVETPIKDITPIAVALVIAAGEIEVKNCLFQNIFGYGLRIHGASSLKIDSCNFLDVGGRGKTLIGAGIDEDGMGDAIYMSSFKTDFVAAIKHCTLRGITQFAKRSRVGITVEYNSSSGRIIVENTTIKHYAKCIHNESTGSYVTTVSKCNLSDFNLALAHTITRNTIMGIDNTVLEWDLMDGQEAGPSPILSALASNSNAVISFSNSIFRYNGLAGQACVIGGIKKFDSCDFYINNKNLAFSDGLNALFESCRFFDFGGSNSSFTNWTAGATTFKLSNCNFQDGGPVGNWNIPSKAPIIMVNCQHNTNNALLYPNEMPNWNYLFPYQDGLVTQHVILLPNNGAGDISLNAVTCPSPLWHSRRLLVLIIGTDINDSRKIDRQRIINPAINGYYKVDLVYTTAGFFQVESKTLIGGDNAVDGYNIYSPDGLKWKKNTSGAENVTHIKLLLIPKYYEGYI